MLKAALLAVVLVAAGGALFFYRPWSEFSLSRVVSVQRAEGQAGVNRKWHTLVPTRRIRASASPRHFERTGGSLDVRYEWHGSVRTLDDYLAQVGAQGFVVLADGRVVHEWYGDESSDQTLFMVWSVAKSFTVTMLAIALHDGRIGSLDDLAGTYAPQFRGTPYGETSLRHLAMMASGIAFDPDDRWGPISLWNATYLQIFWFGRSMDDIAASLGRRTPPGREFRYRFPDTHVLSAAIRGAYGNEPYPEIVERELWQPAGFGADAFWAQNQPGDAGVALGHCCLSTRLIDMAHLGQIYLENGVWGGTSHFPGDWLDGVRRPNAAYQEPAPEAFYPHRGYSRQFWIPEGSNGEFYALGGYGQFIWIDLARNVVIAQTAAGDREGGASAVEQFRVFRAVAAAASGAAARPLAPSGSSRTPDVGPP